MSRKFLIVFFSLFAIAFTQELTIATDDNFPPYSYKVNDEFAGLDIEVLRELEKRSGYTINIKAFPWKRVLHVIEDGIVDGGFSLFRTEEREEYALFLDYPIHRSIYSVFVKQGKEFSFNSISDLFNKKIGINRGFAVNDEFDQLKKAGTLKVIESEDEKINFKLLESDRIDVYIGNLLTVSHKKSAGEIEGDFTRLEKDIVEGRGAFLVLSKKSDTANKYVILQRFNEIFKEMYEDGTIEKIENKYIDSSFKN